MKVAKLLNQRRGIGGRRQRPTRDWQTWQAKLLRGQRWQSRHKSRVFTLRNLLQMPQERPRTGHRLHCMHNPRSFLWSRRQDLVRQRLTRPLPNLWHKRQVMPPKGQFWQFLQSSSIFRTTIGRRLILQGRPPLLVHIWNRNRNMGSAALSSSSTTASSTSPSHFRLIWPRGPMGCIKPSSSYISFTSSSPSWSSLKSIKRFSSSSLAKATFTTTQTSPINVILIFVHEKVVG